MDGIRLPLVGEPLALDLVNTRFHAPGDGDQDVLATPDGLHVWLAAQRERLAAPGDVNVDAVRRLRDHVADAVENARNGAAPPAEAMRAINQAQRAAPAYRQLQWRDDGGTATEHRTGDPTADLLAELADAAISLLSDPAIHTVKRCAGPRCTLLFLPGHPRRQWCSPTLCGNRSRVARYYQRHKT